jgi:hypothetical protein
MKLLRMSIFAVAFALTACSDHITTSTEMVFDGDPPPAEEVVTFSFVQENILDVSCALSGCHAGAEFPDLAAGRSYANIVDALSSQGLKLVEPGDPDNSYLFIKITGGAGMSGQLMPYGGARLPDARIDAVRKWIADGALND